MGCCAYRALGTSPVLRSAGQSEPGWGWKRLRGMAREARAPQMRAHRGVFVVGGGAFLLGLETCPSRVGLRPFLPTEIGSGPALPRAIETLGYSSRLGSDGRTLPATSQGACHLVAAHPASTTRRVLCIRKLLTRCGHPHTDRWDPVFWLTGDDVSPCSRPADGDSGA